MQNLSGALMARLADSTEVYNDDLIDEINRHIDPPRPIVAGEVNIRAMYIVSDQVNSQGGRFATEDFSLVASLLIDSPVMIGHKRDSLPVARNFKTDIVEDNGHTWIKSYFYWMKNDEQADALLRNIDGGIYKECSISFLFRTPQCSICGDDIRNCRHVPFREYETPEGQKTVACFYYRDIEKVLETSLVFRGAVPDTRITDKLSTPENSDHLVCHSSLDARFMKPDDAAGAVRHADIDDSFLSATLGFRNITEAGQRLPHAPAIYAAPYQPGLVMRVSKKGTDVTLTTDYPVPDQVRQHLAGIFSSYGPDSYTVDILLYCTRGKERLSALALTTVLTVGTHLHRLHIRLCDAHGIGNGTLTEKSYIRRLEEMQNSFSENPDFHIDIFSPQMITASDISAVAASNDYKHGFEIGLASPSGLHRHIFVRQGCAIGRVTSRTKRKRRIEYTVTDLTGYETSFSLPARQDTAIATGSFVRLSDMSITGLTRLVDILPGVREDQVDVKFEDAETHFMMAHLHDDCLVLSFQEGQGMSYITIHHYKEKLLGSGRTFIADQGQRRARRSGCGHTSVIALASLTESGGLKRITLSSPVPLFGDCTDLCLRPVLIDGRRRYLFYSNSINCRRGE